MKRPLNAAVVVVGVTSILLIVAALVTGVVLTGRLDARSVPLVSAIIGMAGSAIPAILALSKVTNIHNDMQNGLIPAKVNEALDQRGVTAAADVITAAATGTVAVATVPVAATALPVATAPVVTPDVEVPTPDTLNDTHKTGE